MGLCIDIGYEIVTSTINVSNAGSTIQTTTITAPAGKKAVGAGLDFGTTSNIDHRKLAASYPEADGDWVFKLVKDGTLSYNVTYSVVFINT